MTPEGPYRSKWADKAHFITGHPKGGVAVVADGQQPHEGTRHADKRSARSWMKDNGFELKEKPMTEAVAQEPATAKYDARSIVDAASAQEPETVRQAYADQVIDRVYDLVKAKRLEVAQMFGKPPEPAEADTEDEVEDGSAEA